MVRTDDIINVAGHRLSTGAMEEVLASHSNVAECAVIGVGDPIKGEVSLGLLVLKARVTRDPAAVCQEVVELVRAADRAGRLLPDGGSRQTAAQDPLGQDPARDDAADCPRAGLPRAGDDRRPGDPAGDREALRAAGHARRAGELPAEAAAIGLGDE